MIIHTKFDLGYHIKNRLFYRCQSKAYNFMYAIKRIWTWIPVLWEDRDWDHGFILTILEFKIKQNRLHIEKYGTHLHNDRDSKSMRIAEILIERIRNENYCKLQLEEHRKKWGEYEFDNSRITRAKVITTYDAELELAESKRISTHQEYLRKQDWDYLSKHLKDNMATWWD